MRFGGWRVGTNLYRWWCTGEENCLERMVRGVEGGEVSSSGIGEYELMFAGLEGEVSGGGVHSEERECRVGEEGALCEGEGAGLNEFHSLNRLSDV